MRGELPNQPCFISLINVETMIPEAHPIRVIKRMCDEVLASLGRDRAKGYSISINQVTMHSGLIAMLLPTGTGEQALVLGISGLTLRLLEFEQKYVRLMRKGMKDFLSD